MSHVEYHYIIRQIEECGSIILARDGKLQVRDWYNLPPKLQDDIQACYSQLLAILSERHKTTTDEQDIADLAAWLESGAADCVPVPVMVMPGTGMLQPGQATAYVHQTVGTDLKWERMSDRQRGMASRIATVLRPHIDRDYLLLP